MVLLEIKDALIKILSSEEIDWLSEDEIHMIVVEAERIGIKSSEDIAQHLFMDSKVFKKSC